MKPSVNELRHQCRIDSDDDTEDVMLTLYLNASLKHAEKSQIAVFMITLFQTTTLTGW